MLPDALQGLLAGEAYGHAVRDLRVIETHISWVLLTGDFAYKIKRPVRFPFVDFSTLERRAFFCQEELRLNQRFAPGIYLDVCPIVVSMGRARMGGAGEPIEYAVRMRQFDPRDELGALLASRRVAASELVAFAQDVVAIQKTLPPCSGGPEPDRTAATLLENAAQCQEFATDAEMRDRIECCRWRMARAVDHARAWIAGRAAAGYLRDGHGDLHVSNVARIEGRLRPFDCLEFEPAFRCVDVAHEIAFLTMDLDAHGARPLAAAFTNAWLAASGDYAACQGLNLFEAHCALVRAKVAGISVPRVSADERGRLIERQRTLVTLAEQRLSPSQPSLILMHGLSGSGKSWLADQLSAQLAAIWVRADVERKRLAGLALTASSGSAVGGDWYTPERSRQTYQALLDHARSALAGERSVLVDATFLTAAARRDFVALARQQRVPIILVSCTAPPGVLKQRIESRARSGVDPSEATLDVLDWQMRSIEPPDEAEGFRCLVARTDQPDALPALLQALAPPSGPARGVVAGHT